MSKFPDVQNRTFKEPTFLDYQYDPDYYNKWETEHRYNALVENKDTNEKKVTVSTADVFFRAKGTKDPWQYAYSHKSYSTSTLYRCVGGPLDGQTAVIGTKEYVSYNCAENSRGRSKKQKAYPTGMLIHKSLLT